MARWPWIVAGAVGAVGGALLAVTLGRQEASVSEEQHYGLDEPKIATAIPAGYRRLGGSEVTPELASFARTALRSIGQQPYGTTMPYDGGRYLAMVEQHYHEPLGPRKPWGYHHGITLLTRA